MKRLSVPSAQPTMVAPEKSTQEHLRGTLTDECGSVATLCVNVSSSSFEQNNKQRKEDYAFVYYGNRSGVLVHNLQNKVVSNLYDCLCYIGASKSNYGKTWLAYCYKLKEEHHEAN